MCIIGIRTAAFGLRSSANQMTRAFIPLLMVFVVLVSPGQKKTEPQQSVLSHYNLSDKHAMKFTLPHRLSEASGLAMTADGRLFSHGDERGVMYQLDYTNGKIVKQFSLGKFGVKGDFEDIAIKGKTFYLVESSGTIYEFREGEDGGRVGFKSFDTFLSAKNNVEGLCYDSETDCLLLLCRGFPGKGYHGSRAVYSFSLKTKTLAAKPRFVIPLDQVTKTSVGGDFQPSAITRHPKSGTFLILAGHGFSIIELSKDGKMLAQEVINQKINPHAEGIAFAPDLSLMLCNDGQGGRGSLTVYPSTK